MVKIGIVSDRDQEKADIRNVIKMLAARENFECSVCCMNPIEAMEREEISVRIIALEEREQAFRYAEKLWEREQSALVIYVAYRVEDVIVALGMPFFHIVRLFGSESGLHFRSGGYSFSSVSETICGSVA